MARAHERRRRGLDLRLGRVHVRVALGGADRSCSSRAASRCRSRSGRSRAASRCPAAACRRSARAGRPAGGSCRCTERRCRPEPITVGASSSNTRVDEVVAAVVRAAHVLDQPDGRGVVRARELHLEVAHEAVVDAVDAHVEVLDAAAHRHEQVRRHAAGVVVRDRQRLGLRVGRRRARAAGRDR